MTTSFSSREGGYSLLQMAIALVVIGVLLSPLLYIYDLYQRHQKETITLEVVQRATDQIMNYRRQHGAYPCPAPLKVARTDPNYGKATDCRTGAIDALAAGACDSVSGICKERAIFGRSATLGGNPNDRVIVGAIPFRLLQIDEKETFDGYRDRLVYAVTRSMTDRATFNDKNGAIEVRDENDDSLVQQDDGGGSPEGGAAHYVVISMGPDRVGAYSSNGSLVIACPNSSAGQNDNCNNGFEDGSAASTRSRYRSAYLNTKPGASYFDDVIAYFSQKTDPSWRRTGASLEDIEDLSPNFVGVGTPTPQAELDILAAPGIDSLRIYGTNGGDGKLKADKIYDQNQLAPPFAPKLLGGNDPDTGKGMKCPAGYAKGIENGGLRCGPIKVECPNATPVLNGINAADNSPICGAVPSPSCPAQDVSQCAVDDVSLPASPDGTVTAAYVRGSCRSVKYKCASGVWGINPGTTSGSCAFAPVTTNTSGLSCAALLGAGWSGTYTSSSTTVCSGGSTVTNDSGTACVCTPDTGTNSQTCNAYYGGGTLWVGNVTRTWTRAAGTCAMSYGAWDTSGCACNTPADTSSYWEEYSACPSAAFTPPPGYTKPIRQVVWNAGACKWQLGGATQGCTCTAATTTTNVPHTCANPACEDPNPADQDQYEYATNPATCAASGAGTLVHTGSCTTKATKWVVQYDTGVSGSAGRIAGDSCTCASDLGASAPCLLSPINPAVHMCKCQ